ncbi:MAG: hypothetical protein AAF363_01045 [Bacteroidota bacterium]
MSTIKVGILASYDWKLLKHCLPRIYNSSDKIVIALDIHRKTWSGNHFAFDENEFKKLIESLDEQNKIQLYEDSFYLSELSPMECEVRERNLLARELGKGGWHIQVDCDEYFIDFEGFTRYLKKLKSNPSSKEKALNVCAYWIPLVKKLGDGYLFVKQTKQPQSFTVATTNPKYIYGRVSEHFNHFSPFFVLHDTWARSDDAVLQKLENWGHANDFNVESYYRLWKALDEDNYHYLRDCYFIKPYNAWPELDYLRAESIDELLIQMGNNTSSFNQTLHDKLMNYRIFARLVELKKNIFNNSN